MNEASLILYNDLLLDYNVGTPVTVEFNFNKIWQLKKLIPRFMPELLYLYHVHPEGYLNYSELDRKVMKGFSIALGESSHFHIVCFKNANISDLSINKICFRYNRAEDMVEFENFFKELNSEQVAILKLLAYGNFNKKGEMK